MGNFKEDMFNAIGLIGKPREIKKPERLLLDRLNDRLKYIQNKISNCWGYSESEKKARYDEILNTMEMVKELFNVEL